MTACVLCFGCCKLGESYKIFSEAGLRLNICKTINKHFWLELSSTGGEHEEICHQCWECVANFNVFYQRVYNAHQERREVKNVPIEFCVDPEATNPLAFGTELDALDEDFFASNNVKVEVNELEPLPKLEMLEEAVIEETKATKRACVENTANAKRRIKKERLTIASDSDGDVPLAEFLDLKKVGKPLALGDDQTLGKGRQLRRSSRRGCRAKTPSESPPRKLKKEFFSDDEHDNDNDIDFVAPEAVLGTDDSESSSESSDSDSGDSLPDIEPEERYAEIPKRVVVKPKKYRKRVKPLVPPVRMSREEIEKRKAQQTEYDEIIFDFFKKLPCHICNLLVPNFGDMRRHQRMSHNLESGFISCCGRKFHIRKGLAEHVLVHKNPEHFMCTQCGRVFQESKALETHEQTHTNPQTEKTLYPCEKCPKSFTTKAALEYHNLSKHVPKSDFKYSCPECNKKMPTARKLKQHLRYMHDPESAIICDKCGKTLRTQANLKKHHELEHSDAPRPKPDPVQCEICGTWLRHMSGLKQHMSTVHEPPGTEHRCPICDKKSTNARALKRHIYHNHQCERKFRCTMCEKAFKRPQDLREHTSTHTGEVLYTCPNCPQTFFSNANMYKHRQRLHRAEWEADRKKPLPPNIMKQAVGATSALKKRHSDNSGPGLFGQTIDLAANIHKQEPQLQ